MPTGERKPELDTERGVSPAISVVLMVSVALLIAAVIGAVVLGLGEETEEPAPVVTAELDRETVSSSTITDGDERIELSHRAGDSVSLDEIRINTEARCFDNALLTADTKQGELINLPVGGTDGIQEENIQDENIFQEGGAGTEDPLSGSTDTTWESGETLVYHIKKEECSVPDTGTVTVEVIHEPTNSIIVEESLGEGFQPAALEDEIDPATAGDTSTHTLVLNNINYGTPGNSGDEVDEIIVDYNPDNSGPAVDFNGINKSNVDVTMTRTLSGGLNRSSITLYGSTYTGSEATFNTFVFSQTDVAGPISIEMNGIKNPSSADTYDVEITLTGDAGPKTFTKTIDIES
jgi:FlaG/FlaF family flagellin (archaellin)